MVRAPCCEKMGLKKGPWTPEEDQILISYIQKNGHGNWRALPKQAGLLRCGKSCRLRWTNYLRPDIKRGNFTKEEEDTIIKLHEVLGNRWSAIAARLPGRTDNEIKNVWHTHLKKKLKNYNNQTTQDTKRHPMITSNMTKCAETNDQIIIDHPLDSNNSSSCLNLPYKQEVVNSSGSGSGSGPVSPQQSSSEMSSVTDSSAMTNLTSRDVMFKQEEMNSHEYFPQIDESFWSDEISKDDGGSLQYSDFSGASEQLQAEFPASSGLGPRLEQQVDAFTSKIDEDMDFWFDIFIRTGELPELPEF